jgi:hypothetical protein
VRGNPLKYTDPTGHFSDQELIDFGVFSDMDAVKRWQNSSDPHNVAWYYKLRAAQLGDEISGFVNRGLAEWTSESIMFAMIGGRLSGVSASGELFGVFASGFKSASTGDWMFTKYAGALTTTDGKRLATLEQLRQHVLPPRAGSNVVADWVQTDLGGCNYVCLAGSKREDLYHQVYWSIAFGIGTPGPILAITGGSLQTSYVPDASQLENHSTGWGITASGGTHGFGGVYNVASSGPDSHGGGLMWPGFSLVVSYSWK